MQINDPEDQRLQRVHADRLIRRDIDQLLGICEFALQDGHVDQNEANAILEWLGNHQACLDTWPASVLFDRLRQMLSDQVLDADEQGELLGLILSIARPRANDGKVAPSSLPLNQPVPEIIFEGRSFCFTGVFTFGKRSECQAKVIDRGGISAEGITKKLHYLVIGDVGSEVWRHSSFGTKIAKAVEYRETGIPIAIISETQWVESFSK